MGLCRRQRRVMVSWSSPRRRTERKFAFCQLSAAVETVTRYIIEKAAGEGGARW